MLTAIPNGPPLTAGHRAGTDTRPVCRQRRFNHWVEEICYEGGWEVGPLRDTLTGHISTGDDESACTFTFEGCGLILQFWSHSWGGVAAIEIDGARRTVDLLNEQGVLKNVHFDGLPAGVHVARISGTRRTDARPGNQIVLHEAIVYDRLTEVLAKPAGQLPAAQKPLRFNIVLTAPGALGWAERTLLYALVFGTRPANAVVVGRHQAGAAAIVVAALDDLGAGQVTCVDPDPDIPPEQWAKMGHRTALVTDDGLTAARNRGGAAFDFAYLDGAPPDVAALVTSGACVLTPAGALDFLQLPSEFSDGGVLVPQQPDGGGLRLWHRR